MKPVLFDIIIVPRPRPKYLIILMFINWLRPDIFKFPFFSKISISFYVLAVFWSFQLFSISFFHNKLLLNAIRAYQFPFL